MGSAHLHNMPIHTKNVSTSYIDQFYENTRGKKKVERRKQKKKKKKKKKQSKNNMFPNFVWGT